MQNDKFWCEVLGMLEANYDKTNCNVLERVNLVTFDRKLKQNCRLGEVFADIPCVIHKNWLDKQMRKKMRTFLQNIDRINI